MTQEEFDQIIADNIERRTVTVTGLAIGFDVQGQRIFVDPVSGQTVFQTGYTVAAPDSAGALAFVTTFVDTGVFS